MLPVGHMIEAHVSEQPRTPALTPPVIQAPPLVLRVTVRCQQRRHQYVHLPARRAQVRYAHASPWLTPGAYRCRR